MTSQENYSKSLIVFAADLGFLESNARKYKFDALKIKQQNQGTCSPSFHLLSSIALELFPKVLVGYNICIKYKDDEKISEDEIREEISSELKKFNHHLEKLYKAFPELLKYLNIEQISEFKNGYVWEYRIKLTSGKEILLKDVEAVRYGSFARSRDIMTLCIFDDLIVDLLNRVEKFIEIEYEKTYRTIASK